MTEEEWKEFVFRVRPNCPATKQGKTKCLGMACEDYRRRSCAHVFP